MNFNILQIILIFLVTFVVAIDQFSFLESLYQPIITGPIIGNMPVGGAQPPNAVIGGIVSVIFAVTSGLDPNAAVAAAIPFALLGQYGVTLIFTLMSPVMTKADQYAKDANPKGIEKINYFAMALIGTIFGIIVVLFFIAGSSFGAKLAAKIPETLMDGLGVAGGMMKIVGFAVLLRLMISKDLWGFFFIGFSLAVIVMANESLSGAALLIISIIGFGIAFWDYQIHLSIKNTSESLEGGEDGI